MADDVDPGVDKQKILAEIGASAPLPGERTSHPPAPSHSPPPLASHGHMPAGALSAMAPPTLPAPAPPPVPVPLRQRQGRFARHRRMISALILVFVGMIWFGVALATKEWAPTAFGGGCVGLAILTGASLLLREA